MKKIFFLIAFVLINQLSYAQIYYQHWVARYGTSNDYNKAYAIALDEYGNKYITGTSSDPVTGFDCVTLKYNNSGALQWSVRYNGPMNGIDKGSAIALDDDGNVYVTGHSHVSQGYMDFLTLKYNSDGIVQWVRTYHSNPPYIYNGGESIAIDALSGDEIYIVVTGYRAEFRTNPYPRYINDYVTIKYNSDGVQQWIQIYNGTGNDNDVVEKIAVDASGNSYITGHSEGSGSNYDIVTIKYNQYGSQQWVARYNGSANSYDMGYSLVLDENANAYVVGTSGEQYRSLTTIKYNTYGSQQWRAIYYSPNQDDAIGFDIDILDNSPPRDDYVYVTGFSTGSSTERDFTTIKYSSSGTQQWVSRYASNKDEEGHRIAVDAHGYAYVTGFTLPANDIYDYCTIGYDPNGNQKWMRTYNGTGNDYDRPEGIVVDANQNVFVTGFSRGIGGSSDYDYATIKYSTGLIPIVHEKSKSGKDDLNKVFMFNNESGYIIGNEGMILLTENGGLNWTTQESGTEENLNGIHFANNDNGNIVGDNGTILITNDGGNSWSEEENPTEYNLYGVYFTSSTSGTVAGDAGTILNTTDGGSTWAPGECDSYNNLKSVFYTNVDTGITVGYSGEILLTTDAGITWSNQTSNTDNNLYSIFLINNNEGFVIGDNNTILYTDDGGDSWENLSDSSGNYNFYDVYFIDDTTGYIVGSDGIVLSTINKGEEWESQNSNTENNIYGVKFSSSNVGIFSGSESIILLTTLGEIIDSETESPVFTKVQPNNNDNGFKLHQNYPNPFNPITNIKYNIPKDSRVTIEVFDILGRRVMVLTDEFKKAGSHEIIFNGSSLSSGIYFYKINAGSFSNIKRMILIK